DRVSEPERLYILARYYEIVEGAPQKTIETYQLWNQTYPKDFVPHSNLATMYSARNELEKAVEEYRTAISLSPDEPLPYSNLAEIYQALNRADEGRRLLEDAIARGVDSSGFRAGLYALAFFRNDEAEMVRQIEAARRFTDGTARMLAAQLIVALFQGQLSRAQELAGQYRSEAVSKLGLRGSAASLWSEVAESAAVFGDAAAARAAVRMSLGLERNVIALVNSAFATVVCGAAPGAP